MAGVPIRAGFLYASLVFAIGFALGAVRELLLRRFLAELPAILLEIPLMLALSWVTARRLIARLGVAARPAARLGMGFFALALLLAAEAGVGIFLMRQTLVGHLQSYFSFRGGITLASQSVFALIPWLSLHARRPI